ncbi:MAG: hypothetical protein B6242_06805 [Anaerolineaceae bacterium 4572_78]|nr:MAG: hypothetical protein B6242_06805 [Anaerolineaceae bacterium 4572_78]
MNKSQPKAWNLIRSEQGPDLIIFQARFDWLENPRNAKSMKAVILEVPDWVNIVAITPAKKVIVVHQYRFGTKKISTEIPAGIIEPDETSQQAAIRELREETGYTCNDWEYLGWVEPNSAFQNNRGHVWLANNVLKTHSLRLDEGEDISVSAMSLEELQQEMNEGRIRNSLSVLALSWVFGMRREERKET